MDDLRYGYTIHASCTPLNHIDILQEYLLPLEQLNDNMRVRTEVAGILRQLRLENIQHKYESEEQAAKQHYEVSERGALSKLNPTTC